MAQQLSKADKIRKIIHLPTAEIAKRIGCRMEYVRAVRQRTSANGNPIESTTNRNWRSANRDDINRRQLERWHNDPTLNARRLAVLKHRRASDPEYRALTNAYLRDYRAKRRAEARAS